MGDDGGDLFFTMPGQSDGAPEGEHIRVRLLGTVPSLQWDGDGALPRCLFMEVMRKPSEAPEVGGAGIAGGNGERELWYWPLGTPPKHSLSGLHLS